MLRVSPGALPRHKRRLVFSIRHFPIGCGPQEIKSGSRHAGETSSPAVTDTDDASGSPIGCKKPVAHLVLKDENPDDMEELQCSKMCVMLPKDAVANPANGKIDEAQEFVREKQDSSKLQDGHCYSKVYGTPKRRKLSAMRQFPPGCGSSSGSISDFPLQPSCAGHPLLKSNKSLVGKKMDGVSNNLVLNEIIEGQMRKSTGVEVIPETGQETHSELEIRSHTDSHRKNKKPALKQQEIGKCLALLPPTENYMHAMETVPFVNQPLLIDCSARVVDTETNLNCKKSMVQQAPAVAISMKERVSVVNRNDSDVTKRKEINFRGSNFVRSNDGKNFYGRGTQGTSSHVKIKLSTKSGSSAHLAHSVPIKMLEGCKDDQSRKKLQIKENVISPLHVGVESKSASKLLNKEGRELLGKRSVKENEITQKSSNILKINLSGEVLYKDHIPDEVDDSLEAHGDRMIIQAMMDAKNCPRRNFKSRGAVSYTSAIPKIVINERGLAERSSASKVLASSWKKNKSSIEGDDYMLGEQKIWRKHRTFQKPNESNVIRTPFVLSKLSQKGSDNIEVLARRRVKRVLRLFQLICRKLLRQEESSLKRLGKINRIDLHASNMLKKNNELVNYGEAILGNVPGVEIGDEFHYRVELSIIGLHRLYQGGIDSMKQNGMTVAVSIVASGGYHDEMDGSDVLIYSGSGGNSVGADKQPEDQKLERGNLALKNSIDAQSPVRVIYGFKEKCDDHDSKGKLVSTFTYAGLYHVESYWQERGPKGSNVFKFQLKRKAGQPELAIKELKLLTKLKIRQGLCFNDISLGKEKVPVSVINTIDTDLPMIFKYITKNIYSSCYVSIPPRGCNCLKGCSDSENCACAAKNGGELPYNFSGAIVQAKPLIYECGPSCKCPPSCYNRVGQHGFRIQLEVFKTKGRGWGVRSLKSISSGSFICEYIGELLLDGEAEQRANDEYLFDIGQNYDDQSLLDGLPYLKELQSTSACDTVENVGFTIDASEYGNIGRFINHSCSPNLYAQNVLYDHDDKRMPHIMFFAVDNIPPLQELTYHYNYKMDQVHDSEGNIKQKACHCGSPECCGRLY